MHYGELWSSFVDWSGAGHKWYKDQRWESGGLLQSGETWASVYTVCFNMEMHITETNIDKIQVHFFIKLKDESWSNRVHIMIMDFIIMYFPQICIQNDNWIFIEILLKICFKPYQVYNETVISMYVPHTYHVSIYLTNHVWSANSPFGPAYPTQINTRYNMSHETCTWFWCALSCCSYIMSSR